MAAKLTRLAHKIAIQLHLVAESCTICSSRSRRQVRKLLDTPSHRRLGWPQTRFERGGEEKNSQPLSGLEPPIIQPVSQLSRFLSHKVARLNCSQLYHSYAGDFPV
jgi:hypothetical protein